MLIFLLRVTTATIHGFVYTCRGRDVTEEDARVRVI